MPETVSYLHIICLRLRLNKDAANSCLDLETRKGKSVSKSSLMLLALNLFDPTTSSRSRRHELNPDGAGGGESEKRG